jgi:hypothetical protein
MAQVLRVEEKRAITQKRVVSCIAGTYIIQALQTFSTSLSSICADLSLYHST